MPCPGPTRGRNCQSAGGIAIVIRPPTTNAGIAAASAPKHVMVEFFPEAEVYLLRAVVFLFFLIGLGKYVWYEISPIGLVNSFFRSSIRILP
jgi:hypothetical protein